MKERTDTERLDWVLGHLSIEAGQTTRGIWYYEYYPADGFEAVRTTGASIRECIDKAMDEEQ